MIHVDMMLLAFLSGSAIPLATGVLTKITASSGVKAFVSAFLSAVTAIVAYLTEFVGVADLKTTLFVFFTAWVTHAGTYYGFWKPTTISTGVQQSTATVGIG